MRTRRLLAAALASVTLLAGCNDDDPVPPQPTDDDTATGVVVQASTRAPKGCELPPFEPPDPDAVTHLVYGIPDQDTVPGVVFVLWTTATEGDRAELEITRRGAGCQATTRLEVPARESVGALGMRFHVSELQPSGDPHRGEVGLALEPEK